MVMMSGLHSPNNSFEDGDFHIVDIAKPLTMKLLDMRSCTHSDDERSDLFGMGVHHFTIRLNDSKFDGDMTPPELYAESLMEAIEFWYCKGVRWFQVDNEPNWQYMRKGFGPWDYIFYMKRMMKMLRHQIKEKALGGIMFISPPLSYAPIQWKHDEYNPSAYTLDEWRDAFKWTNREGDEYDQRTFYSYFDFAGSNVYWQYPKQLLDPSFGTLYTSVYRDSGLQVVVLEWGCSLHEVYDANGRRAYTDQQVEALRVAHYPDWVRQANSTGMVMASYCWLVGGTPDWAGYRITEPVARALR